ncbi:MAG: 1-acyl-sn-glycerol-3-phosphate acyltransferase [Proteobacteria bacterium]|nr:1-acyl-sn-glycerol-3-phosphate acyltransferase [Pseudomonadota bacterium]
MRALARTPLRAGYAVYAGAAFLGLGLTALLAALALPGLHRRRAAARALARSFLWVAGMPLTVRGMERLTAGQCVVVANHASYLDGLVFTAALPARFGFVIKREMSAVPLAGLFLRRIGSEFVERFDRGRGAADARRVLRNAASGHSLVFFPEGTFTHTPGLLKFHTGAFVTAARAGCPVIPAVVRGTRAALSPSGALPRPGRIEIDILPAIHVQPQVGEPSAATLRNHARQAILSALGEPDLTYSGDSALPPHTARVISARVSKS